MRLSWALVCAIIILRGPLGRRAHMLWLYTVSSAVAVTCIQRHGHWSTMCAKSVVDYKIHICDVCWARGQFLQQPGKEKGRTSSCCCFKLFAGSRLEISSHPPKGLQGCEVPFVDYVVCLFLLILFFRGPSTEGRSTIIVVGWGVDWMGAVGVAVACQGS